MAFNLEGERLFDEFDIAWQVSAERGRMLPAYTMPPNADHVKMLRALVKLDLGHSMVTTLADDIATARRPRRRAAPTRPSASRSRPGPATATRSGPLAESSEPAPADRVAATDRR